METETKMYGLIGKINATPGKRDDLIAILLEGVAGMPGCLSYIIAKDSDDADAIWVTEIWDSKESHEASLSLPSVQEATSQVELPRFSGQSAACGCESRAVLLFIHYR